jgi:hypothetical protein
VVGVNAHELWNSGVEADLQPVAAAGINWLRADFDWADLEPTRGTFTWADSDRLMTATARLRIHVLATIDYSAPWASSDPSGKGSVYYPPLHDSDYALFAEQVVARYGAGGSFWRSNSALDPLPISAVEIWNEPFQYEFWQPEPDARAYGQLVVSAAQAIRSVDSTVDILAAGDVLEYTSHGQLPWINNLLSSTPGIATDITGWSVHPYPDPVSAPPWQVPLAGRNYGVQGRVELSEAAASAAAKQLPLWITEIGWCTASVCATSDGQRAGYVASVLTSADSSWRSFVKHVFLYTWDRSVGTNTREATYGLRTPSGAGTATWSQVKQLVSK